MSENTSTKEVRIYIVDLGSVQVPSICPDIHGAQQQCTLCSANKKREGASKSTGAGNVRCSCCLKIEFAFQRFHSPLY